MLNPELLKKHLKIEHDLEDDLLEIYLNAAIEYAADYQKVVYDETNLMPKKTEQAILMLASAWYEKREAEWVERNIMKAVNRLLYLDRVIKV